ncbi:MAG: SDR family oxidoreductase [Spirochaetales bacterium]|nr:SDR family oxidoreductase [Spirochaetales bacterium]
MKVWFITGASKGFGRIWAEAALRRGDHVAASARRKETLESLQSQFGNRVLTLELDVQNREAVFAAVKQAKEHFGRLDVVVNNAGYGQFGAIEELSEAQVRAQFETNVFGALWVTQAALPYLREQKSGHILQVSSIGGVHAFPNIGIYHASKWALEGLSQSLAQEVSSMGIHVTLIEPVGYATDWAGPSAQFAQPNPAYEHIREAMKARRQAGKPGVPEATAEPILTLVDMPQPPLRLFLGATANAMIHAEYEKRLTEWDKYNDLSVKAHGL